MDGNYFVKITTQAREQMREIVRYIASALQAPDTALRILDAFEKEIASLSRFPSRFALTEEEPWRGHGIHKMPVKNYLIYFWIDETEHKVQVTAVVYGRRAQIKQLSQMSP
jgi:toxin ParE1/3/4